MTNRLALKIAAITGFFGVSLGAFGAHGLERVLVENGTLDTWRTAVFYHLVHTLMLVVLADRPRFSRGAYLSFLIGVIVFSGSLYLLAVTGIRWLGAITPIGGVAFLTGWLWLAFIRDRRTEAADKNSRTA